LAIYHSPLEIKKQKSGVAKLILDTFGKSTTIWTEPFALSQQMISKHIAYLVRARIVIKKKRGRESVCTLRPEAIKTVSDWAISYRRFWEESFDKLGEVVNQMKKEEVRDDRKHG
jgi:hypothetical protein